MWPSWPGILCGARSTRTRRTVTHPCSSRGTRLAWLRWCCAAVLGRSGWRPPCSLVYRCRRKGPGHEPLCCMTQRLHRYRLHPPCLVTLGPCVPHTRRPSRASGKRCTQARRGSTCDIRPGTTAHPRWSARRREAAQAHPRRKSLPGCIRVRVVTSRLLWSPLAFAGRLWLLWWRTCL